MDSDPRMGMVGKYERYALAVAGLWLVLCLATLSYNGPFFDEAIYIAAGERTLEGLGASDGYLRWFAGSLLWPVLAALGYNAAGLIGARAVALGMATVAFVATTWAARSLFGAPAAFWTAVSLAVSGPFLALAHLAVVDAPALAGVALSFLAVTEMARQDNRSWLLLAVGGFVLAVFSKYPAALMGLPLTALMLCLRPRKAVLDTVILGTASLAIALAFFLPVREQIAGFAGWRAANVPTFGVTPPMAWFARLYYAGPALLLGLVGWLFARGRRSLASVLLLSLAVWPAYHALSGNAVSENKHIVYGVLFASPLAGLGLSTLWRQAMGKAFVIAALVALTGLEAVQFAQSCRAWPDVRETAAYLTQHVRPGEKLLINEAWPYTMYLYTAGRIDAPWDVFDTYRLAHGQSSLDLCAYDWFVDVEGSYPWPAEIRRAVGACRAFRPVCTSTSVVTGLAPDLRFASFLVRITVWRNVDRKGAR